MADVGSGDESASQAGSEVCTAQAGDRDARFTWGLVKGRTRVAVYVRGVAQVVITPDAGTRRCHAEFVGGTGLNGSPVARARINAIIKGTNPESASEMGRLLKDARKGHREQTGGKGNGWKLEAESDHGEFAREVIAAYFVASKALASEVISEPPGGSSPTISRFRCRLRCRPCLGCIVAPRRLYSKRIIPAIC